MKNLWHPPPPPFILTPSFIRHLGILEYIILCLLKRQTKQCKFLDPSKRINKGTLFLIVLKKQTNKQKQVKQCKFFGCFWKINEIIFFFIAFEKQMK